LSAPAPPENAAALVNSAGLFVSLNSPIIKTDTSDVIRIIDGGKTVKTAHFRHVEKPADRST
jgi:hypothetical protein